MSFRVCKFYRENKNCKFGKNCRFLHSFSPTISSGPSSIEQNEAVSNNQVHLLSDLPEVYCKTVPSHHESSLNLDSPADSSQSLLDPRNQSVHHHENLKKEKSGAEKVRQVCHFFVKHGKCAFGENCRFAHNVPHSPHGPQRSQFRKIPPRFQRKSEPASTTHKVEDVRIDEHEESPAEASAKDGMIQKGVASCTENGISNRKENVCRYYKSGNCRRGKNCGFSHAIPREKQVETVDKNDEKQGPFEQSRPRYSRFKPSVGNRIRVYKPQGLLQIIELAAIDHDGTEKYRQLDVNYLQKRFQSWREIKEAPLKENEDFIINITYEPSDPDWPFDVRCYMIELTLPQNYPKKVMDVKVPSDKQDLPESVRRYLEVSFDEWVHDRMENLKTEKKVELMVRPFFKWLDKAFEDVMTEALKQLKRELAAKAAGMEFISAHELKAKFGASLQTAEDSNSEEGENFESDGESSDEYLDSDSDDESDASLDEGLIENLMLDADRKGTEITLRNMQLKHSATSLLFEKLHLMLQCSRCKTNCDATVGSNKAVCLTCEKCSQTMSLCYRPTLAHQFSSIIGYLDLEKCHVFDLIFQDCLIGVTCLGCSKLTKIHGMMSGQLVKGWCQACNARFEFATDYVKFYLCEPSVVDKGNMESEVIPPKNKKKPPKDPAIRPGYALPGNGTCRHYKQSYRWLRFPCCGKAYPCDVCHDKNEDHEMVLANRMICGFCCKEQNFSSKPCGSCSQHMTKVRSAHWEGGSGCRDKIAMSRNDQQKYKNMNKTRSKKKVHNNLVVKKNTKLRHA